MNTIKVKEKINGSQAWLRYGSIILALLVFVIAQSTAGGKKTEKIDNLEKADVKIEADVQSVKEDIGQIKLDVNTIQSDVKHTKDDVQEIKNSNKEMLELLKEIKDK